MQRNIAEAAYKRGVSSTAHDLLPEARCCDSPPVTLQEADLVDVIGYAVRVGQLFSRSL